MNKKSLLTLTLLISSLIGFSSNCQALTESQAEELADITASFFYLKKECGYQNLSVDEIKRALISVARKNHWDLSNYEQLNMEALGQASYKDLKGIPIANERKCQGLKKLMRR
ncbi:MAG: YacC family pilotin-like protein [Enterobacteriaceae bacterium]|jgi:hypothetical protein|nr:YacC family pilotin-like protein [Enterobacteriaceae bacterium]